MKSRLMPRGACALMLGALASGFLFSACGSDAPAPRPSHLKPFTFEVDWGGPEYLGYYLAQILGYYDEAGLDVTIKTGGGSAIAAQALLDGTIQVGTASANAIVRSSFDRFAGRDTLDPAAFPTIPAVILPENPSVVITQKNIHIASAEDFAGLKIGYPSSSAEAFQEFQALLDMNPGLESRVMLTEFFLQGGQQFRTGEIDGLITYLMDVPADLEADGVAFNTIRMRDLGMNVAGQCIVVAPGASVDGAQLDAFLQASFEGWEYVRRNPENAAKLFSARYPQHEQAKVEIIARQCASLLPAARPGNVASGYTDPAQIRASILSSLNLILGSKGWQWDDAERDRFIAAFLPAQTSAIPTDSPAAPGSMGN